VKRTSERSRRSDADAVDDLIAALACLGVEATADTEPEEDQHADLAVRVPDGSRVLVDVKALAGPSPSDVAQLVARVRSDHTPVLVADRLVPASRQELNEAGWGWLDRRGHLRLRSGTLIVDADLPTVNASTDRSRAALDTSVGLDVACALLAHPTEGLSVRRVVDVTGRSLAAVHQALTGLRKVGLADSDGRPIVPELFWEVSPRWRPQRVPLAGLPAAGDASRTQQLCLGLDEPESTVGWAVCDTIAAYAYGAPAVVGGAFPPDFYVAGDRVVRVARQLYGDAISHEGRAATVAVPPAAWACRRRVDTSKLGRDHPWARWPAVHPVFAALDLAVDPARGREILDDWSPPDPFRRVW
jgi:hypothetical protein